MSIIVSQGGMNAKKIDKSNFEKEDYLQNYIHQNPESIPVYEIEEDKHLFVAAREFPTESGSIDALAIDKDGDIYIVETKLFKNPDKRTVVAQALDYGAALWKHQGDFNEFIHLLDEEVEIKFNLSFKQKVTEFFSLDEEKTDELLEAMRRNLFEGNLKFVILMDEMEDRLKDLIIYVNRNSQFDIYAIQLDYYKFNEYEIMIPKLFGVETKKNIGVSHRSSEVRAEKLSDFLASTNAPEKGSVLGKFLTTVNGFGDDIYRYTLKNGFVSLRRSENRSKIFVQYGEGSREIWGWTWAIGGQLPKGMAIDKGGGWDFTIAAESLPEVIAAVHKSYESQA
ncbi:MAG: hypothetical protein P4L74_04585 [Candidatus Doudnabacteria bacterium]|nr:hypothetical protein [Candidatus Doudnabacteria bacterium]